MMKIEGYDKTNSKKKEYLTFIENNVKDSILEAIGEGTKLNAQVDFYDLVSEMTTEEAKWREDKETLKQLHVTLKWKTDKGHKGSTRIYATECYMAVTLVLNTDNYYYHEVEKEYTIYHKEPETFLKTTGILLNNIRVSLSRLIGNNGYKNQLRELNNFVKEQKKWNGK